MDFLRSQFKRIHFGTVLGILVAIYIAFYLIQTVHHNYQLQQQIGELQTNVTKLQSDTDQLRFKIQYYQTDEYKEKVARAKLGLQAPGEGVVILPHQDEKTTTTDDKQAPKAKPSHWQQWLDFLQGKTD